MKLTKSGKKSISLLKQLRIYTPYMAAIKKQKNERRIINILNHSNVELINTGFLWSETKEGGYFWFKKDDEIKKLYLKNDTAN